MWPATGWRWPRGPGGARPSEAQLAAIIQAGGRLRWTRPAAHSLHTIIAEGLARADAAIMAGKDAEAAIVDFVAGEVSRGDRVAERCGGIAAGLLDDGDSILTHGFAGAALSWMLHTAHVGQGNQIRLYATETRPDLQGARLTAHQAHAIGVPVTLLADSDARFLPCARHVQRLYRRRRPGRDGWQRRQHDRHLPVCCAGAAPHCAVLCAGL